MINIYILAYEFLDDKLASGIMTFTNKQFAIETARYYRDILHCDFVSLRHDKQCHSGWCDIKGFIEF